MGKELENLFLKNAELLETNKVHIPKEEIDNLQGLNSKLNTRIKELEEELKKTKEKIEKKDRATKKGEEEDDVPMADRKTFSRREMARVLLERNQYKERLRELQEADRWTEMMRTSREHSEASNSPQKQKKGSIRNFFSNLVDPVPPGPPPSTKASPSPSRIQRHRTQIVWFNCVILVLAL